MANEVTDVDLRIALMNNEEDAVYYSQEFTGIRLNPGGTTPTTDPRLLPFVNLSPVDIGPDDKVVVYAKPSSTTTFKTTTNLEIPVTILNTTTKVPKATELQRADIFTADVTMTTGQWNRIGAYTLGRQKRLVLGKKIAEDSKIRAVVRNA